MAKGLIIEVQDMPAVKGGLLDVLKANGGYQDVSDPHMGTGIQHEDTGACSSASLAPGLCDDELGIDPLTEKTFVGPVLGEGIPFGIYTGVECSPMFGDFEALARKRLEVSGEEAVEAGFKALGLNAIPVLNEASGTGAPVSVEAGIAALEQYVGSGGGYIMANRYGASWLTTSRQVTSEVPSLHTRLGTPIVGGRGFGETGPNGQALTAAGNFFAFVTGPVHMTAGGVLYNQGIDVTTNTERGLAEQLFAFTMECDGWWVEIDPSL